MTGYSYSSETYFDYATVKYNSAGLEQWVMRYNGPGNSDDYASSIAVDNQGDVYVTGYSEGTGWRIRTTIKYAQSPTGIIEEVYGTPKEYKVNQNYPNPFNTTTVICFGLPKTSHVNIDVYNILGQKVATLLSTNKPAGYHKVRFDGQNFASGLYYYKIAVEKFIQVKKMLLLR